MVTRAWKVYGYDGHRQRASFSPSCSFTTGDGTLFDEYNSDKTGTNDYTIVKITAETPKKCSWKLETQLSDGIFENARYGACVEIFDGDKECEIIGGGLWRKQGMDSVDWWAE